MAVLKSVDGRSVFVLGSEQEVGRAERCGIRLEDPRVSTVHASLRWRPENGWQIRDLGSRNRTWVGGQAIGPDKWFSIERGSVLAFGDEECAFALEDDRPPRVILIPDDGGPSDAIEIEHETLAQPPEEAPVGPVLRGYDGAWQLETAETTIALRNRDRITVAGRSYVFVLGQATPTPSTESCVIDHHLREYAMTLRVSRDEEHVDIRLTRDHELHELPSRACHYLLLTLARFKVADLAEGLPETSSGWVYLDDLAKQLARDVKVINVDVYRVRRSFAKLGIPGAAQVIERRPRTGQMRVSLPTIVIERA